MTVYTVMKCKACDFACGEKTALYAHIESAHLSDRGVYFCVPKIWPIHFWVGKYVLRQRKRKKKNIV